MLELLEVLDIAVNKKTLTKEAKSVCEEWETFHLPFNETKTVMSVSRKCSANKRYK